MLSFGWQRFFLTMFAGAIGALAMPPFFGLPALFLSIPLLIWMLDGAEATAARKAWFGVSFSLGFAYGLGFFAVALHWIGAAFFVDGGPLLFVSPS
ncbi:apolipoprotein N-acyltransferase, partial [bacterium]|nr:apolipoprotein N-acyltransferase [bacterium]